MTRDGALALDLADPLAAHAAEFERPRAADGTAQVYLCGHSLGLQPRAARDCVLRELEDWRRLAVRGHHEAGRPWIGYHEALAAPLAALVGAKPNEVVAMNSLTVNLHLMMVSFFRPRSGRGHVLIEKSAFPSDRYAIVSQLQFHGLEPGRHLIEVGPRPGERCLRTADLVELIEREGSKLALVLLPGVQYLSGQRLDLAPVIRAAHAAGAMVGLDLAHAIGNTPLELHDWNADFAAWCSYKYLNAGPGAIGGCFVHERRSRGFDGPRFAGWWGHQGASRFAMPQDFEPIDGAQGWQLSNPPILSSAPLIASLEIFARAGMTRLREKSIALTGFLRRSLEELLGSAVEIITPQDAADRGCQLSVRLVLPPDEARRCALALAAAGVIGDWREPDVIRLAPVPLYNSFADAWTAAATLARVMRR